VSLVECEGLLVSISNPDSKSTWLRLIGRSAHVVCTLAFIFSLCIVCLPWHSPLRDMLFPYALAVVLLVGGFTLVSYLCVIAFVAGARLGKLWRRFFGS
jgi:hypothetical protein